MNTFFLPQLLMNSNGSIKYILSGEGAGIVFTIDDTTGDIHAIQRLDREERSQYTLRAQALDRRTGRPMEPESEFIIKIQDINDNEPKFLDGPYVASVPEMSPVGTSVIQVTATDADDPTYGNSARVVYSVLQGQPYFSVDSKTGLIRTALMNMDREAKEYYEVIIQAKDMGGQLGGLAGTTTVNISLSDVNDNPPRFPQSKYVLESAPISSTVGHVLAEDLDEGINAEMKYSFVDGDGLDVFDITTDLNYQAGIITVRKVINFSKVNWDHISIAFFMFIMKSMRWKKLSDQRKRAVIPYTLWTGRIQNDEGTAQTQRCQAE
uniref:Cadherin 20 n=1 Tax=Laticauda laticaudata TaxID=8630 RepID=A0A8C5WS70_LATLA